MSMIKDVTAFHDYLGAPVRERPSWPHADRIELRRKLIKEEGNELLDAIEVRDMTKVADGAADLIYVVLGTLIEFGIVGRTWRRIWRLVHAANMNKGKGVHTLSCDIRTKSRSGERRCTCGVVKYRDDGKVAKPADFVAPDADIARTLKVAGYWP